MISQGPATTRTPTTATRDIRRTGKPYLLIQAEGGGHLQTLVVVGRRLLGGTDDPERHVVDGLRNDSAGNKEGLDVLDRYHATIAGFVAILSACLGIGTLSAQQVVVEAEAAVSTNFAVEPVLLFGAGDNRTLQLNEQSLLGDTPYYAEFAVYAPTAATYRFWYGGSIPGSRDPLLPSYGSPLTVTVNDQPPRDIFWEDVSISPTYSSPYRWIQAGAVPLEEGLNRVRIQVRERRRFDGQYFLYLDKLVFQGPQADAQPAEEQPESVTAAGLPPATALQDEPESIEDLLVTVRDRPDDIDAWIRLADLYTLVGDHINAIRYLNRAAVIDAADSGVLGLLARNNLWRGDLQAALETYWRLLSADPQNLTAGVVGRVYGGLYQVQLFDPARPDPFALESAFRGAADLTLELTRRSVAFQVETSVSRVWDGAPDFPDFYSVGVAINAIVRNPGVLTP